MPIALVISELYRPKFQLFHMRCDLNIIINHCFHQHVKVLLMFKNSYAFLTVYLFRSTEMDLTMKYGGETLVEEIIALSAGAFTMTTGAFDPLHERKATPSKNCQSSVPHRKLLARFCQFRSTHCESHAFLHQASSRRKGYRIEGPSRLPGCTTPSRKPRGNAGLTPEYGHCICVYFTIRHGGFVYFIYLQLQHNHHVSRF